MTDDIELVAEAIHNNWQGTGRGPAHRTWAETCEKLPGQAESFRQYARVALRAPTAATSPPGGLLGNICEIIEAGLCDDLLPDEIVGNIEVAISSHRVLSGAPCTLEPTTWEDPNKLPDIPVGSEREFICAVYRKHSGKVYTFSATYLNAYRLNYEWGCPNEKSQHICDECEDGCPTTGWFTITGADDEGSQYQSLNLRDGDELRGWRALPAWDAAPPVRSAASIETLGAALDVIMDASCEEQLTAATSIAGNIGMVLVNEPPHPDSPHASPEPDAVRRINAVSKLVETKISRLEDSRDECQRKGQAIYVLNIESQIAEWKEALSNLAADTKPATLIATSGKDAA